MIIAGYFNSTLNPIIYVMTNQEFKVAFTSIVCKLFCCRRWRWRDNCEQCVSVTR